MYENITNDVILHLVFIAGLSRINFWKQKKLVIHQIFNKIKILYTGKNFKMKINLTKRTNKNQHLFNRDTECSSYAVMEACFQ